MAGAPRCAALFPWRRAPWQLSAAVGRRYLPGTPPVSGVGGGGPSSLGVSQPPQEGCAVEVVPFSMKPQRG